jgi:hypothetical protein
VSEPDVANGGVPVSMGARRVIGMPRGKDRARGAEAMKFIEMTGKMLKTIVNVDELHVDDLSSAGVKDDTIVRVNLQGDIEVRRPDRWDVIGGLLGNYEQRMKKQTGMDWA